MHAKDDRGIQINCVENLEKGKQLDPYDHIIFNYFPVFVEVDVQGFLELSDRKKKVKTLEIVHEGMKLAACEFNWDTSLLDEIYEKVKQLDYQNIYPLIKKAAQIRNTWAASCVIMRCLQSMYTWKLRKETVKL
ncbi:hypothetical protein MGI18_23745 [Bacillus sp. OVS6]|nr:hypothetical protein MGI18_23745 [Bacillus sp. OVS6]